MYLESVSELNGYYRSWDNKVFVFCAQYMYLESVSELNGYYKSWDNKVFVFCAQLT